ncbi:cbb3-type cytochrome oxidase assembly protein CcoS [Niabella beijingensis]|uniref:cbb3-type cytochrome oxidase assembly protein CcoS n=1 Tax=Niabella beijingensis TaxID=2872700 RepID=UPI001CC079D5|nr:cbb3-type cytochrome oxidase assembly protein CcoS [Niabella beijingensis]
MTCAGSTFTSTVDQIFTALMNILIITAVISLFIAALFLVALIWSIKDGQFDDAYAPPNRILFDEKNNQHNK